MSRANMEIVERVIDAFNRRDVDAIFACVNQDVEWFPAMPVTFGGGALRGREGIESYIREVAQRASLVGRQAGRAEGFI